MPLISMAATTFSSVSTGSRSSYAPMTLRALCPPIVWRWDRARTALTSRRPSGHHRPPTWPMPMRCWPPSAATSIATARPFNVTSRTSGFVPGAPFIRHFSMNDYAFYINDKWKISAAPHGYHWAALRPARRSDERDGLELMPTLTGSRSPDPALQRHVELFRKRCGQPVVSPRTLRILRPTWV